MSKEIPHNGSPKRGKRVPRLLLAETEPLKDELETLRTAGAFCEAGLYLKPSFLDQWPKKSCGRGFPRDTVGKLRNLHEVQLRSNF